MSVSELKENMKNMLKLLEQQLQDIEMCKEELLENYDFLKNSTVSQIHLASDAVQRMENETSYVSPNSNKRKRAVLPNVAEKLTRDTRSSVKKLKIDIKANSKNEEASSSIHIVSQSDMDAERKLKVVRGNIVQSILEIIPKEVEIFELSNFTIGLTSPHIIVQENDSNLKYKYLSHIYITIESVEGSYIKSPPIHFIKYKAAHHQKYEAMKSLNFFNGVRFENCKKSLLIQFKVHTASTISEGRAGSNSEVGFTMTLEKACKKRSQFIKLPFRAPFNSYLTFSTNTKNI